MESIPVGRIVDYVVETRYGNYCLPAQIFNCLHEEQHYHLRVFTDSDGSEWIVSSFFSEEHLPGSFHFREGQNGIRNN